MDAIEKYIIQTSFWHESLTTAYNCLSDLLEDYTKNEFITDVKFKTISGTVFKTDIIPDCEDWEIILEIMTSHNNFTSRYNINNTADLKHLTSVLNQYYLLEYLNTIELNQIQKFNTPKRS